MLGMWIRSVVVFLVLAVQATTGQAGVVYRWSSPCTSFLVFVLDHYVEQQCPAQFTGQIEAPDAYVLGDDASNILNPGIAAPTLTVSDVSGYSVGSTSFEPFWTLRLSHQPEQSSWSWDTGGGSGSFGSAAGFRHFLDGQVQLLGGPVVFTPVPEPAAIVLFVLGLGVLCIRRRNSAS